MAKAKSSKKFNKIRAFADLNSLDSASQNLQNTLLLRSLGDNLPSKVSKIRDLKDFHLNKLLAIQNYNSQITKKQKGEIDKSSKNHICKSNAILSSRNYTRDFW